MIDLTFAPQPDTVADLATVIPMRRPTSPDEPRHRVPKGQPEWLAADKWHAESPQEAAALAHLRGWQHFGPVCPLCRGVA